MITRGQPPVKQNPQSFLHCRKIAENRRKTQKRCKFNLQMGCRLDRQNDLEWLPLLPGCGTQHPHRALGGTCVLLAAAPTTPPCFRRWRRSSSLLAMFSGKIIFNSAFAERSAAMKAPVELLSGRAVCVSRWRGFAPTSSMQVSVEDEIRNHRSTDISYDMISGGHEHEVRCKSLPFQHGHRLCGTTAPGWEKNFH